MSAVCLLLPANLAVATPRMVLLRSARPARVEMTGARGDDLAVALF